MSLAWEEVTTSIKSFVNPKKLPPLIIIAGGKSSRMGYPKGLLIHQKRHLIMSLLDVYRRAGGKKALIVLGFEINKYFDELFFLNKLTPPCSLYLGSLELSIIVNKNPETGPFSSIQAGIEFFKNSLDNGILYHSVDRPPTDINSWHDVINFPNNAAVFYQQNDIKAQPVWLSNKFALSILKEDAKTTRLDKIIEKQGVALPFNHSLCGFNINNQEDWEKVKPLLMPSSPLKFEIVGKKRSGKTTYVKKLINELKQQSFKVGGILQPSLDNNFESSGYDIENIETGERIALARRRSTKAENGLWFDFNDAAFEKAYEIIIKARKNCDVLVVDEIGKLEAKGLGHKPALDKDIISETSLMHILSVRDN